ncbi:MAG: tRNA (guanine-N1)-methyltransferase [Lutibacter sp.]|uniref:coiled-coil domain-containing protein n=1 Tax=Lutibacter sp. TaxID=1925666 RepID=UPI00299F429F|nr:tRNA (guanine-N1)-methyltransferase [Lutibacter sp.]MDX1828352.1 tRNA (guanine-N1)-methyltransferase [Lutibacter sp.]
MKKQLALLIATVLISWSGFSQINKKFIDTGSVKNQFNYLIEKSNRYQNYKVVQYNWLQKLKRNVEDSLVKSQKEIIVNYQTINKQKATIDSLQASIKSSNRNIETLTNEKQSISFLGMQIKKATFKSILFFIIGVLALLLAFFISKFKQSNSITQHTKETLKELENEYNEHRTKALEREQKVMRKLQDELNKNKKE